MILSCRDPDSDPDRGCGRGYGQGYDRGYGRNSCRNSDWYCDRNYDVLGAKKCGLDCVGVEFFGYAAPGELAQAGAVAVVQTAQALEAFILTH